MQKQITMNEVNLKLKTITIKSDVLSIKTELVFEEPEIENCIPKRHRKRLEKLLIEELKREMNE